VIGLACDYVGSNNVAFLEPDGSFGSRLNNRPAASRYLHTCKKKIFDLVFRPEDRPILPGQEFEGTPIEPKFMVPVVPLLVMNGSSGIATGFAQDILPRNPSDVISALRGRIKGKPFVPLTPWFRHFEGSCEPNGDGGYRFTGNFNRINTTTIEVTELPPGFSLDKYLATLDRLEDTRQIVDYKDFSSATTNRFNFIVRVTREFSANDDDWIRSKLRLVANNTDNWNCFREDNSVWESETCEEVLEAYYQVRLRYYGIRKEFHAVRLREELEVLFSKFIFVKLILDGQLKVFRVPKAQVEDSLGSFSQRLGDWNPTSFPFDPSDAYLCGKAAAFESLHPMDGNFDYLLNMPIHSLSEDTYASIAKAIEKKAAELKKIETTSPEESWLAELTELEEALTKYE
jgi:DNA topoisomerase-2